MCKVHIAIPLRKTIRMPIVKPAFKINILKMEHAFHMDTGKGQGFLFIFDKLEGWVARCFFT